MSCFLPSKVRSIRKIIPPAPFLAQCIAHRLSLLSYKQLIWGLSSILLLLHEGGVILFSMFWRRPPEAQLLKLLASSSSPQSDFTNGSARADRTLSQIEKLLKAHPDLVHTPLVSRGGGAQPASSPEVALTLALKEPCWREDFQLQLQLIELLFQYGAAPAWPNDPRQKSHYLLALENGAYDAAEKILERGVMFAGADETLYSDLMMPVFRAALSVRLLPPETDKSTHLYCSSSCSLKGKCSQEKRKRRVLAENHQNQQQRENQLEDVEGQLQDMSMQEPEEENDAEEEENDEDEIPAELTTPAMLAAAWLIDSCPNGMLARLKPNGAPSVVHALLAAFAEHVEEEAHRKHTASAALAHIPQPQRSIEEERLKAERSESVARLLHRLWALLQLALAEGSPAVSVDVDSFPMPPQNPICDLDLVWTGVKNFATAWMPGCWTRETHCLYHKNFKDSVQTFVLAASTRGLGSDGGGSGGGLGDSSAPLNKGAVIKAPKRYVLDSALVERIVGFMATDQKAWVPVV